MSYAPRDQGDRRGIREIKNLPAKAAKTAQKPTALSHKGDENGAVGADSSSGAIDTAQQPDAAERAHRSRARVKDERAARQAQAEEEEAARRAAAANVQLQQSEETASLCAASSRDRVSLPRKRRGARRLAALQVQCARDGPDRAA